MRILKAATFVLALGMCAQSTWPATETHTPRVIEVRACRFEFRPSDISVKIGEPVQLKLVSDDVAHSLLIKELGINQVVTRNKPAVVSFTPTHSGTFIGQCGHFCGEGHGRMSFTIQVTEN